MTIPACRMISPVNTSVLAGRKASGVLTVVTSSPTPNSMLRENPLRLGIRVGNKPVSQSLAKVFC